MIYVSVEARLVRRPPELVWDALTDLSSSTAWIEGLVEVELDDDARPGEGLTMRVVRREGARRIAATAQVTAWEKPSLLAVETRAGSMLFFDRVTLTRVERGTLLGVFGEIASGGGVRTLFEGRALFSAGLLGAGRDPWTEHVQKIYERSVEALVKRIETTTERPYR